MLNALGIFNAILLQGFSGDNYGYSDINVSKGKKDVY